VNAEIEEGDKKKTGIACPPKQIQVKISSTPEFRGPTVAASRQWFKDLVHSVVEAIRTHSRRNDLAGVKLINLTVEARLYL
jgi:hypothetical protein